jgi:predicted amidohydrolase
VAWQFAVAASCSSGRGADGLLVLAAADAPATSSWTGTFVSRAREVTSAVASDQAAGSVSSRRARAGSPTVAIEDEATARGVVRLVEELEETDDVQDVYATSTSPVVLEAVAS